MTELRSFAGIATPQMSGRKISGYAIVFNVKSGVMYDSENRRMFQEVIEPGAVTHDLLKRSDVKAVLHHDPQKLLARSNKGTGTLTLTVDSRGLFYSFEAPRTTDGNDALEMIKRGDISGSSFAFRLNERDCSWTKQGEVWIRKIKSFRQLYDVSIVSDPAYSQTSVTVRSMEKRNESWKVNLELLKQKNKL